MILSIKKRSEYLKYKAYMIDRALLITCLYNLALFQYLLLFFSYLKIFITFILTSLISFLIYFLFSRKKKNKLS